MSSRKLHSIFSGRKLLPETEMRASMITGGQVTLAGKLSREHAWNGQSLLATPIVVVEGGAVVDIHWAVMGALKDITFNAHQVWHGGSKDLKVAVKVPDMGIFTFPGACNLSHWLGREELEVSYTLPQAADGEEDAALTWEEAANHGVGDFSLRCLVAPREHRGAGVWVAANPHSKEELEQSLGANSNSHITPHITQQRHEELPYPNTKTGRAAYAIFTRQEQERDGYGVAVRPWIDVTAEGEEDAVSPDPDDLKESVLRPMRDSTTAATATMAVAIGARMRAVAAGTAQPPRNLPHVFPEFQPSVGGQPPAVG